MPYPPHRIKFLIYETGKSLGDLADEWSVKPEEMSMCINQTPGRVYPEIRLLICDLIECSVDEVFGSHPLTTALLQDKQQQGAA